MGVFLPDNSKLIILKRHKEYNKTQLCIDNLKDYNVTYINTQVNLIDFQSLQTPALLGITDELEKFFKENNFKYNKNSIQFTDIVRYISACKKFNNQYKCINDEVSYNLTQLKVANVILCNKLFKFIRLFICFNLNKKFNICKKAEKKYFPDGELILQYKLWKFSVEFIS